MINLFNFIERKSVIHDLAGATKLVCLIFWMAAAMMTYDTRLLLLLTVFSFLLFRISKIRMSDVSFVIGVTLVFLVMNNLLIFLFSPQHGTEIYGTSNILWKMTGRFALTKEQLFYHFNLLLKYTATIPIVILFVSTTNPSEFAASLNRIGVPYSIAYSVALALRYIPDIQRDYHDISQAQQARGIELSKKAGLGKRLKSAMSILIPLILSSMDRIEVISNAMELRGFGKNKKRTWYMAKRFSQKDYLSMSVSALLLIAAIFMNFLHGGRFYNPFL